MGILIREVSIKNFHSLHNVNVSLGTTTVLIGANNAGKTSFLRALHLALGIGKRNVTKEDIYIEPGKKLPKDREAIIDVLIRPIDDQDGTEIDTFDDIWREYFGNLIMMDTADKEFVAIRTIIKYDPLRDYYLEQYLIETWPANESATSSKRISRGSLEKVPLYYIDAQRDITEDIKDRSSYWGRLVSDVNLSEEQIKKLERQLNKINAEIVDSSDVLKHIKEELGKLNSIINKTGEGVKITPLTRKIRDLNRGMDIYFQDGTSEPFPVNQHGMGTRSWAALLVFSAYASWLMELSQGGEDNPSPLHTVLALEEPEAHLHPHGQRQVFKQVRSLPGQKIISSHSPYLVNMANIDEIRHFNKKGEKTIIKQLDIKGLDSEDIRKIQREVMNTRGEILYASAIILFEGETEEEASPIFAEHYFRIHPNELGFSFVGVGGSGKYLPFLRLATAFEIPWFIFSDGEEIPLKHMRAALKKAKLKEEGHVVIIPDGNNFEKYLLAAGYFNEIQEVFKELDISKAVNDKHRMALLRSWTPKTAEELVKLMKSNKTQFAPLIAEKLCKLPDANRQIPPKITELFELISNGMGIKV